MKPYRFSEESVSASAISPFDRPPTENRDQIELMTTPLSAYGDNEYIEDESDAIFNYPDTDTSVYGY